MPTPRPLDVVVARLEPKHQAGMLQLFEASQCACHCRYWHFPGDKYDWQNRMANAPEKNRSELQDAIASGSQESLGLVALDESARVVGWLKLAPKASMSKLYEQRPYRGLGGLDLQTGVYTVGCLLVHPNHRRRQVGTRLLAGAVSLAKALRAVAIEAFPRRDEDAPAEQLWTGPYELFARAGFQILHEIGPYPVLRLVL